MLPAKCVISGTGVIVCPSQLYAVTSRTVCPDISLIIQDLLPSNPALLSEFQHLFYIDEKSMMLSCICAHEHCATNPELTSLRV